MQDGNLPERWARVRVHDRGRQNGMGAMQGVVIRAAALALALGAIACGDPDVSGTWKGVGNGTGTVGTGSLAMTLQLRQNDTSVTGTGSGSGRGGTVSFSISGSAKDDNVDLTMNNSSGFGSYHAKLDDDDTMVGTYTEPGFTMALTVNRQ